MRQTLNTILLVLMASSAHAQGQTTTTQTGTIAGTKNCQNVTIQVSRTIEPSGAMRTWLNYMLLECSAGSTTPTTLIGRVYTTIPDGAYQVFSSGGQRLIYSDSTGTVDITWTPTKDEHNTYSGIWTTDNASGSHRDTQNDDTRSASATGVLLGRAVDMRGYVAVSSRVSR